MLIASRLFSEKGFDAVSMSDIARKAKIRPASIYYHFESKEALYEAILENIKGVYEEFFRRTDVKIAKAQSFVQMLDRLFDEAVDVYDMHMMDDPHTQAL